MSQARTSSAGTCLRIRSTAVAHRAPSSWRGKRLVDGSPRDMPIGPCSSPSPRNTKASGLISEGLVTQTCSPCHGPMSGRQPHRGNAPRRRRARTSAASPGLLLLVALGLGSAPFEKKPAGAVRAGEEAAVGVAKRADCGGGRLEGGVALALLFACGRIRRGHARSLSQRCSRQSVAWRNRDRSTIPPDRLSSATDELERRRPRTFCLRGRGRAGRRLSRRYPSPPG